MVTKFDKIYEALTDIQVKVGKIEEHLKHQNGKVNKNQNDIEKLETKFQKHEISSAKRYGIPGLVAGIVTSIGFIIKEFWI